MCKHTINSVHIWPAVLVKITDILEAIFILSTYFLDGISDLSPLLM